MYPLNTLERVKVKKQVCQEIPWIGDPATICFSLGYLFIQTPSVSFANRFAARFRVRRGVHAPQEALGFVSDTFGAAGWQEDKVWSKGLLGV